MIRVKAQSIIFGSDYINSQEKMDSLINEFQEDIVTRSNSKIVEVKRITKSNIKNNIYTFPFNNIDNNRIYSNKIKNSDSY